MNRLVSIGGAVLAFALGCGRSVRESGEGGGPHAGESGADVGARGGSAGAAAGTPATGGSATGGVAGSSGGMGGGGSGLGGASGSAGEAGDGGDAAAGGSPDVPGHDDFVVRSNLMSDYEGLRVYVRFDHNFGPQPEERSDVISNGSFEVVWPEGFDRDSFGAYVVLFVDRGNDAMCTLDVDPAWVDFQSNISPPGGPEIFDFDPDSGGAAHESIGCDELAIWIRP